MAAGRIHAEAGVTLGQRHVTASPSFQCNYYSALGMSHPIRQISTPLPGNKKNVADDLSSDPRLPCGGAREYTSAKPLVVVDAREL